MMWIKSTVSLAIVLASVTTYGDQIYKWTDENGQVHYDNSPAKSQKNVAGNIKFKSVSITDSKHQETEAQYARDKGRLGQNSKPIESTGSKVAASDSTQVDNGNMAADHRNSKCEEEWRKYRESQECFAPYAKDGGGVRGDAFEHCTAVTQPAFCN